MKKGRVNELQNKIITHCGMSIPFFNNVFLKEPDAYLFQDWEEVTGIFSEQNHDFQLVLPDRFRQSNDNAKLRSGIKYSDAMPAMVFDADTTELRQPAIYKDLQIMTVSTKAEQDDFRSVAGPAFDMPDYICDRIITEDYCLDTRHQLFVGYLAEQPVATSLLYVSEGVAGIYWVATEEACRGQGLGEALTYHACLEGLKCAERFCSLQASKMGEPVYRRMGFKPLYQYNKYPSTERDTT